MTKPQQALIKLNYSVNKKQNNLLYQIGYAVVIYLQERYPQLINQYLSLYRKANNQPLFRKEKLEQAEALLKWALQDPKKTKAWLREHIKKLVENSQKNEIPSALIQQTAGYSHFDTDPSSSFLVRDAVMQPYQSTKETAAAPAAVIQL